MKVEAPERIWIESEGECPYFYHEEELSDVAPPSQNTSAPTSWKKKPPRSRHSAPMQSGIGG